MPILHECFTMLLRHFEGGGEDSWMYVRLSFWTDLGILEGGWRVEGRGSRAGWGVLTF